MKHAWRWVAIAALGWAMIYAAGTHTIIQGLLLADVCAVFWALRVHVILEPRWSIDDELIEISTWT